MGKWFPKVGLLTGKWVRGPSGKKTWEGFPVTIPEGPEGDKALAYVIRKYRLDRPNYDEELKQKITEFNRTGVMADGTTRDSRRRNNGGRAGRDEVRTRRTLQPRTMRDSGGGKAP